MLFLIALFVLAIASGTVQQIRQHETTIENRQNHGFDHGPDSSIATSMHIFQKISPNPSPVHRPKIDRSSIQKTTLSMYGAITESGSLSGIGYQLITPEISQHHRHHQYLVSDMVSSWCGSSIQLHDRLHQYQNHYVPMAASSSNVFVKFMLHDVPLWSLFVTATSVLLFGILFTCCLCSFRYKRKLAAEKRVMLSSFNGNPAPTNFGQQQDKNKRMMNMMDQHRQHPKSNSWSDQSYKHGGGSGWRKSVREAFGGRRRDRDQSKSGKSKSNNSKSNSDGWSYDTPPAITKRRPEELLPQRPKSASTVDWMVKGGGLPPPPLLPTMSSGSMGSIQQSPVPQLSRQPPITENCRSPRAKSRALMNPPSTMGGGGGSKSFRSVTRK